MKSHATMMAIWSLEPQWSTRARGRTGRWDDDDAVDDEAAESTISCSETDFGLPWEFRMYRRKSSLNCDFFKGLRRVQRWFDIWIFWIFRRVPASASTLGERDEESWRTLHLAMGSSSLVTTFLLHILWSAGMESIAIDRGMECLKKRNWNWVGPFLMMERLECDLVMAWRKNGRKRTILHGEDTEAGYHWSMIPSILQIIMTITRRKPCIHPCQSWPAIRSEAGRCSLPDDRGRIRSRRNNCGLSWGWWNGMERN